MKKIIYLFVAANIFLTSCSKDEIDVTHYDPSELNEIQEGTIDVVHKFTLDNLKQYKSGGITKSDFYDNLLDSMATYLADNTPVTKDRCYEILKNVRDSCSNFNLETDTVGRKFHRLLQWWEDDNSNAYLQLKEQHIGLRLQGFAPNQDAMHRSLLVQASNLLPTEELNEFTARVEPVIVAHSLFDSGQWDIIKSLYPNKVFSCAVAALVAVGMSEIAAGVVVGGAAAVGTAATATVTKHYVNKALDAACGGKSNYDLPYDTSLNYYSQINAVFGFSAGLLDLVENHLDTE